MAELRPSNATSAVEREHLPHFNPFLPEFRSDPYPFYCRYREYEPVHAVIAPGQAQTKFWYLFRYDDVAAVLKDMRFGREAERVDPSRARPPLPSKYQPFLQMVSKWMLFKDPPDHTRLRSLMNKAFTPRVVEQQRPRIEAIANDLLDQVEGAGMMDLINDFAFSLPVTVIAELLGVHPDDRRRFKEWSTAFAMALNQTKHAIERATQATIEFTAYLQEIVAERRRRPQDDLISGLIVAEEQGKKLSEEELISTCILLLGAGHETTSNLIGNSVLALLRHPAKLQMLKEQPELIRAAIEELLRYDSPIQMTFRTAFEDVEIAGHLIRRGEQVGLVLGAANRDPQVFTAPDCLDLTRNDKPHKAFGLGIHYCVGAPLARVEGQIGISTLLSRFPNLRLEDRPVEWRESISFRGPKSLPVIFEA